MVEIKRIGHKILEDQWSSQMSEHVTPVPDSFQEPTVDNKDPEYFTQKKKITQF